VAVRRWGEEVVILALGPPVERLAAGLAIAVVVGFAEKAVGPGLVGPVAVEAGEEPPAFLGVGIYPNAFEPHTAPGIVVENGFGQDVAFPLGNAATPIGVSHGERDLWLNVKDTFAWAAPGE
jgi:hypothetical protein